MVFKKGVIPWNKNLHGTDYSSHYKDGHPRGMLGKKQSKEAIEKRVSKIRGKKRPDVSKWMKEHYDIIHTPEAIRKVSEHHMGMKRSLKSKLKQSETIKRKLNKYPELVKKLINNSLNYNKPNKSEQLLDSWIQETYPNQFKFVGDGQVIIERFNPDWINCNGKKLIIELFGIWHNKPKGIERDRRRLDAYSKIGFDTLIIWYKELNNKKLVLDKINNFLGENK